MCTRWYWIGILIFVVLLAGCAPKAYSVSPKDAVQPYQPGSVDESYQSAPMEMDKNVEYKEEASGSWGDSTISSQDENVVLGNRVVIKNADMVIVVDSPVDKMETIKKIAVNLNGYVSASNVYKRTTSTNATVQEATISIRVPAEQIDTAINQIRELVDNPKTDIISENVSSQDVTKEYTDLNSRLKNLQNTEEQLQMIMDKTDKTEDVLQVYRELTQVREQIEVLQGQINYYKEASAFSTISVNLVAKESIEPLTVGQWRPEGVAQDALQALVNALKFFVNAGIWIILFVLPVFMIIALPFVIAFVIIRSIVLRKRAKKFSQVNTDVHDTPAGN